MVWLSPTVGLIARPEECVDCIPDAQARGEDRWVSPSLGTDCSKFGGALPVASQTVDRALAVIEPERCLRFACGEVRAEVLDVDVHVLVGVEQGGVSEAARRQFGQDRQELGWRRCAWIRQTVLIADFDPQLRDRRIANPPEPLLHTVRDPGFRSPRDGPTNPDASHGASSIRPLEFWRHHS